MIYHGRKTDRTGYKLAVYAVGLLGAVASAALGGGVAWATLQGRVVACEAEMAEVRGAQTTNALDHQAIRETLADIRAAVARVEGRLQGVNP